MSTIFRLLFMTLIMTASAHSGDIVLPVPTRTVLKNGLTVILLPQDNIPLVAIRLVVRTGASADPPGREGLAAFTAALLKKGAGARSAVEIAEEIEFCGGSLDADHSHDATVVSGSFLSRDAALALSLVADMTIRPSFDEQEIAREREQLQVMIAQTREDAGYLADTFYNRFIYGSHPYSRPTLGTELSIDGITREDILAFHRTYYRPDNAFLVIVGDVRSDTIIARVGQAFGPWKRQPVATSSYPSPVEIQGRKIRVVDKSDMTQSHIRIGALGIPRNHPDYLPILIANTIFGGGGFSSRLVDEIRVNRGLTYDIESRFSLQRACGTFTISTFTRTEATGALIEAILEELAAFHTTGVSDSEITAAKQYLSGVFPLSLEGPASLASQLAGIALFGLPDDTIQTYRQRVQAVTAEEVARVTTRYFSAEALTVVILGNGDRVIPQVERFGAVERHGFRE